MQICRRALFMILVGLLVSCGRILKVEQSNLSSQQGETPDIFSESGADPTLVSSSNSAIKALKPALAIRGGACIICHARISSNLITDFGYKGDGQSLNYFGGRREQDEVYGDMRGGFDSSWSSLTLDDSRYKVVIPKTTAFPATSWLSAGSLKNYFSQNLPSLPTQEVASVFIGAPSEQRLLGIFGTSTSIKYVSATSNSLKGVYLENNSYFKMTGEVYCDGDLFVSKPLFIKDPVISTTKGCRIYATQTVFIEGPVKFAGGLVWQNLQISSSRAILLGFGLAQLQERMKRGGAFYTRSTASESGVDLSAKVQAQNDKIIADAALIGDLKDATTYPESGSRIIDFERILLNAPQVHSRYMGRFDGVIIAEIAVMSLGQFRFQFDSIFSEVPVLPILRPSDYLQVQD